MARQFRVQAPEVSGPEALRPPGLPSDTFTGAPRPVIDNNLSRVADALGSFNHNLMAFGSAAQAHSRKAQAEKDLMAAQGRIAGLTPDQHIEAWQKGAQPNYATPQANILIGKVTGRSAADQIYQGLSDDINAGKVRMTGEGAVDLPTEITTRAKKYMADAGLNPEDPRHRGFMSGFVDHLQSQRHQLGVHQEKVKQKVFEDELGGAAQTAFQDIVTKEPDPAKAVEKVRGIYNDIAPSLPVAKRFAFLDAQMIKLADKLSTDPRYVDTVKALLTTSRKDPVTGQDMPPISATGKSDPDRAQVLLNIARNIEVATDKKVEQTAEGRVRAAAVEALKRQDGSIASVQPRSVTLPSGKRVVVGQNAQKDASIDYFTWSQTDAVQNQRPLDMVMDREVRVAMGSNISVPHLEQVLKSAVPSTVNADFNSDPAARQRVLGAYEVYRRLSAKYKPWVDSTLNLDKNTRDFYQTMDVLTRGGFADTEQAMAVAQSVVRSTEDKNPEELNAKLAKINGSVGKLADDGSWFFNGSPSNIGLVQQRVKQYATLIGRANNLDADSAVAAAKEYVKKTMLQVNGSALVGDPRISEKDTREQLEKQLDTILPEAKKRHLYKDLKKSDVALTQGPDGTITLSDKRTWMPLMLPTSDGRGGQTKGLVTITPQMLIEGAQKDLVEKDARVSKQLHENAYNTLQQSHDSLDKREAELEQHKTAPFYEAQKKGIAADRAKLPPRPERGIDAPVSGDVLPEADPNEIFRSQPQSP